MSLKLISACLLILALSTEVKRPTAVKMIKSPKVSGKIMGNFKIEVSQKKFETHTRFKVAIESRVEIPTAFLKWHLPSGMIARDPAEETLFNLKPGQIIEREIEVENSEEGSVFAEIFHFQDGTKWGATASPVDDLDALIKPVLIKGRLIH